MNHAMPPAIVAKRTALTLRDVPYPKALAEVTRQMESQIRHVRAMVGPAMTDEICNSLYVLITDAVLNEGVAGVDVVAAVKTFTRLESLSAIDHSHRIPFEFASHLKFATAARKKQEMTDLRRAADEQERKMSLPPDQVRASVRSIVESIFGTVGRGRPVPPPTETTPYVGREGEPQEAEGD